MLLTCASYGEYALSTGDAELIALVADACDSYTGDAVAFAWYSNGDGEQGEVWCVAVWDEAGVEDGVICLNDATTDIWMTTHDNAFADFVEFG